jgi:hypothetical protein
MIMFVKFFSFTKHSGVDDFRFISHLRGRKSYMELQDEGISS